MFSIDMKEWGMENLLQQQRRQRESIIEEGVTEMPQMQAEEP
jgi:hypothetical protein